MAEYIEREAALRTAHIMRPEDKCLEAAIANIPAADVAPVVRCKDCKFYQNHGLRDIVFDKDACHWHPDEQPDPDDFCSCGERKNDGA